MLWEGAKDLEERKAHAGIQYNGSLYLFGGQVKKVTNQLLKTIGTVPTNSTVCLKKVEGKWTNELLIKDEPKNIKLPLPRFDHTLTPFQTKAMKTPQAILFGGSTGSGYLNDLWIFDPEIVSWRQISFKKSEKVPVGRSQHSCVFSEGKLFVFGGWSGSGCLNDVWIFDVDSFRWTEVVFGKGDEVPGARCRHTAVVIEKDMIVSFGVKIQTLLKTNYGDVWRFNTTTLKWTSVKNLKCSFDVSRRGHTCVDIGKNCLLYFGGFKDLKYSNDMFILDLFNNKFEEILSAGVGNTPQDRCDHVMFYDQQTKVVVVHGGEAMAGTIRRGIWELDISHIHRMYRVGKLDDDEVKTLELDVSSDISKVDLKTIERTTKALTKNPDDLKSLIERMDAFIRIEYHDKALVDIDAVLALDATNELAKVNKGICLYFSNQYKEALTLLNEIKNPKDELIVWKWYEYHSKCLVLTKLLVEGIAECDFLIDLAKSKKVHVNIEVVYTKVDALLKLSRYEDALAAIQSADVNKKDKKGLEKIESIKKEVIKREAEREAGQLLVTQARSRTELKDHVGALELLNKAIKLDPDSIVTLTSLSECWLSLKNAEKCKLYAKLVIESDPKGWKGYWLIGSSDILSHNIGKGIKYFEAGVKRTGGSPDLDKVIAEATKQKERSEKAKKHSQNALVFKNQELFDEAIKEFTKAIDLYPNNSEFYHERSDCYLSLSKLPEAKKDAAMAIETEPASHFGYLAMCEVFCAEKKLRSALNILGTGIVTAQDVTNANNPLVKRLKQVQTILENIVSAETNYVRAKNDFLPFDKDYDLVNTFKEISVDLKTKLQEVLFYADEAVVADPTHMEALLLRAKINYKLLMFYKCALDCKEVMDTNPSLTFAATLGASAYASVHLCQFDKSLAMLPSGHKLIEVITQRREFHSKLNDLIKNGHEFYRAGEYEKAIETFSKCIERFPRVDLLYERAVCYFELKKHQESISDLIDALKEEPTFPHLHVLFTKNLIKQEKIADALIQCTTALQSTPYNNQLNQVWVQIKLSVSMAQIVILQKKLSIVEVPEKLIILGEILKIVPTSCKYLMERAKIHQSLGKWTDSKNDLERIIAQAYTGVPTETQMIEAFYFCAVAYFNMKKLTKAYENVEKGAKLNHLHNFVQHSLFIELIQEIGTAEGVNKEAEIHFKDATLLARSKDNIAAHELISKAIVLAPTVAKYYYLRSKLNTTLSHHKLALADAKTCFEDIPDYDNYLLYIQALINHRDYDEAVLNCEEALEGESNRENIIELKEYLDKIKVAKANQKKASELLKKSMNAPDREALLVEAIGLDPHCKEILKEYIDCLIKKDDLEGAEIQVAHLVKHFRDWEETNKIAISYYLMLPDMYDQAYWLSADGDFDVNVLKEQVVEWSNVAKWMLRNAKLGSFRQWSVGDYVVVDSDSVPLSSLLDGVDLDLSAMLGDSIEETVPKGSPIDKIFAVKELRRYVNFFGPTMKAFGLDILNHVYGEVYVNVSKGLFLKDRMDLTTHLTSALGVPVKDFQTFTKKSIVEEVVAQKLYDIQQGTHLISGKDEKSNNLVRDFCKTLLESVEGCVSLEKIQPKKTFDYFSLYSVMVGSLYSKDIAKAIFEYHEGRKDEKDVHLAIPSKETVEILDAISCFGYGSSMVVQLLKLSGLIRMLKSEPTIHYFFVYQHLLTIMMTILSEKMTPEEMTFAHKVTEPLVDYLKVIAPQYYKSKNERMRSVIKMVMKTIPMLKLFGHTFQSYREIALHGMTVTFEAFETGIIGGDYTPQKVIVLCKSVAKYLEIAKTYFVTMFPGSFEYMNNLYSIYDKGFKLLLTKLRKYDGPVKSTEIFSLYEGLTGIYALLIQNKLVSSPSVFGTIRPFIESWITNQCTDMKKFITNYMIHHDWTVISEGINFTSCVTSTYSIFEQELDTFEALIELQDDSLSLDIFLRQFCSNVGECIQYFVTLMSGSWENHMIFSMNNLEQALILTREFTVKISSKASEKYLDEIFQLMMNAEYRIKSASYAMLTKYCRIFHEAHSLQFIRDITGSQLTTTQRIHKFQTKILGERFVEPENAFDALISSLMTQFVEWKLEFDRLKLNQDQDVELYKTTFTLILVEVKNAIYSPENLGPYENFTNQQVFNLKAAFKKMTSLFKVGDGLRDFVDHVNLILDFSLMDTETLINHYQFMSEELALRQPTRWESQAKTFLFGYLSSRNEPLAINALTSEMMIYRGKVAKSDSEKVLLTRLKNRSDQGVYKIKGEISLLSAQEKHQLETSGVDNAIEIISGTKEMKSQNIAMQIKINAMNAKLDASKKYADSLLSILNNESKFINTRIKKEVGEIILLKESEVERVYKSKDEDEYDEENDEPEKNQGEVKAETEGELFESEVRESELISPLTSPRTEETSTETLKSQDSSTKSEQGVLQKTSSMIWEKTGLKGLGKIGHKIGETTGLTKLGHTITKTTGAIGSKIYETGGAIGTGIGGVITGVTDKIRNQIPLLDVINKKFSEYKIDFAVLEKIKGLDPSFLAKFARLDKSALEALSKIDKAGLERLELEGGLEGWLRQFEGKLFGKEKFGKGIKCFFEGFGGSLYLGYAHLVFYSPEVDFKLSYAKITRILKITIDGWTGMEIICGDEGYSLYGFEQLDDDFTQISTNIVHGNKHCKVELDRRPVNFKREGYHVSEAVMKKFALPDSEIFRSWFCKDDDSNVYGTLYLVKDRVFFDPSTGFDDNHMILLFRCVSSIEKPQRKEDRHKLKFVDEIGKVRIFDIRPRNHIFTDISTMMQKNGLSLSIDDESINKN